MTRHIYMRSIVVLVMVLSLSATGHTQTPAQAKALAELKAAAAAMEAALVPVPPPPPPPPPSPPVPVDCVPSAWSAWSACVSGVESRSRTIVTPASNGGAACVLSETRSCTVVPPPPPQPPPSGPWPAVFGHGASGLAHGIPNLCANPTISSTADGTWVTPGTWTPARVPVAGDVVMVNTTVTYSSVSDAALKCVGVAGRLTFAVASPTRLTVGTLIVGPSGTLEVGTAAAPVTAKAEIVIADQPLNTTLDPEQFGTGILVFGTVRMHGSIVSPTFVRLAAEASAKAPALSLESAVNWQAGDRLILPDSRQLAGAQRWGQPTFAGQWEELTAGSASGTTLPLASPLAFAHGGARDRAGVLEFLPHVGNLSRTVIIRSQNPAGTRGHVLVTMSATSDIRYALFKDLGRTKNSPLDSTTFNATGAVAHVGTNQIGRYPYHAHHNTNAVTFIGNAIDGSPKWGVTIHNSHFGLYQANVVYHATGAGIVAEDGSESFNVIDGNFVVRTEGTGGWAAGRTLIDLGFEGSSFWFRGPNNYVRNNVAANAREYGYTYFARALGVVPIPRVTDPSSWTPTDMNTVPILEFNNNEIYGATTSGLTYWWIGSTNEVVRTALPSTVKDFRAWHFTAYGVYGYPANHVVFDRPVMRGDPGVALVSVGTPLGIWFSDYMSRLIILRGADLQGLSIGIITPLFSDTRGGPGPGITRIEGGVFSNLTDVHVQTMNSIGGAVNLPPKSLTITDTRFSAHPKIVGAYRSIRMAYSPLAPAPTNVVQRDTVRVTNFNGNVGDNFSVFYTEQAPSFVVPLTTTKTIGSSVSGQTNSQSKTPIAGAVAPCATTRPSIAGFVCP